MRVLRSSCYATPDEALIAVVRDCDVVDTLESLRYSATDVVPDAFIATDIFDAPDGDIVEATTLAAARTEDEDVAERERNQAILYYWTIAHWPRLADKGVVLSPRRAPLSVEEISSVFEQLAKHSKYRHYASVAIAQDGTVVHLRHDGKVEVDDT